MDFPSVEPTLESGTTSEEALTEITLICNYGNSTVLMTILKI